MSQTNQQPSCSESWNAEIQRFELFCGCIIQATANWNRKGLSNLLKCKDGCKTVLNYPMEKTYYA